MSFWLREVVGWLFISLGLGVFYRAFLLFTDGSHAILEGGSLTVIGIVLFRGGIHLLKVAIAARLCLEAQAAAEPKPAERTSERPLIAVGSRPVTTVPR